VDQSLEHYQTLVDNMGELDQVSEDLRALLVSRPATPVARRLLGDVYMRQGYLQEALDAYRGALDNL
jgi:cytochrome c-type biogenesis protein CcmH/NrfG